MKLKSPAFTPTVSDSRSMTISLLYDPLQQAARASRNPQRGIPGPNAYNLQRSITDRHDFNTGASRVFRLPVAVQLDGPKHTTPAPNQYDVCIFKVAFKDACCASSG